MENVLLTSNGISNIKLAKHLYSLLPNCVEKCSLGIIINAKESFSDKMEQANKRFFRGKLLGFGKIDIIDLELRNAEVLRNYDVIEIANGNPFLLMKILRDSGADKLLIELAENGKIIIGSSAGSFALSPNLDFINYVDKKLNEKIKLAKFEGLNLFPYEIFPHYTTFCNYNIGLQAASENYEREKNIELIKFEDGELLFFSKNKLTKI